jgi:DNA-binding MarR family transcriptional regulator
VKRVVKAHGRLIEVEELDTVAAPSKRRQREAELFIKVPLRLLRAAAGSAIREPSVLFVLVLLLHMKFEAHSPTFACPNGFLERFGVDRYMKRRALAKLEAAGLIAVKRSPRRAPIVTLLDQKSVAPAP